MDGTFLDRTDAGRRLAAELREYAGRDDVIVLGLPRGGIPVAFEVAQSLGVPLDTLVVRKLGVPGHEEYAMGAIAAGGVRIVNDDVAREVGINAEDIAHVVAHEQIELERRERAYRGNRPPPDVRGRTVMLVDDGLATGATMHAAVLAVREGQPARIVVAVPVGASDTCERLRGVADEVVCLLTPETFMAIGSWYADFAQTTDDEVRTLLERGRARSGEPPPSEP